MSSVVDKLKGRNQTQEISTDGLQGTPPETQLQPQPDGQKEPTDALQHSRNPNAPTVTPHAILQCPVTYLPPKEWSKAMKYLGEIIPVLYDLPQQLQNTSSRLIEESRTTQEQLKARMASSREYTQGLISGTERSLSEQLTSILHRQREIVEALKDVKSLIWFGIVVIAGFGIGNMVIPMLM